VNPPPGRCADCRRRRTGIHESKAAVDIGNDRNTFTFDNENPRHTILLPLPLKPLVTAASDEFIDDALFSAELWLSDVGRRCRPRLTAPLYWQHDDE